MISFWVNEKPVPWARARVNHSSRVHFKPEQLRVWQEVVGLHARREMARAGMAITYGAVSLTLRFRLEIPTSWSARKRAAAEANRVYPTARPDIDNYAKAIADAMNGIVYHDDAQIVEMLVRKSYDARPCVRVDCQFLEGL